MSRGKMLLRGLAFVFVLALAVNHVSSLFGIEQSRNYSNWSGLGKEKRGSMDAVFIGASNVSAFWQPPFGWADHGIAVWSMSIPDLTCAAIKHMLIEARKTQPDALYIINLSTFKGSALTLDVGRLHRALNYMPFSLNKLRMTGDLISRSPFRGLDALEFYLPIIRFHSRWNSLQDTIFGEGNIKLKMSNTTGTFRKKVFSIEEKLALDNDRRDPIPEDVNKVLEELLDYCDEHHVKLLFVKSPQVANQKAQGRMNAMEDILKARGYPCLDLLEDIHDIGIDTRMDFFNSKHTNIHGALKFCKAVGDYLVENYGFEDKRGRPGWESWDEAWEKYKSICEACLLPFELEHAPRYFCDVPALSKLSVRERSVKVSWTDIEGMNGYAIYRRTENGSGKAWRWVADVSADLNEYTDDGLKASTEYIYTVVPYREADGIREYGSFDVLGVSAKTKGEKA